MRRTYRSKKETGGGLDPRDMVLAIDPKCSIFEAFYTQNIKQTKRELSVGPSIHVASNKVRKRKYVKRLKDQEFAYKDFTSKSSCLTPDRSIHLKKPLDPFDLLLISFPAHEKCPQSLNNEKQVRGQRKTYQKKKPSKISNYSSTDTTDSDKENSKSNSNQNISDVLSHNLLIEKDNRINKNNNDESISTDLSLLNKLKDSSCLTPNLLCNIKDKSIRQSDQNSPLCSTPFFKKYRGKSIFEFSPISYNVKDGNDNINKTKKEIEIKNESNIDTSDSINIKKSDFDTPKKVRDTSGTYKCSPMKKSYDFDENDSPIIGRSICRTTNSLEHVETDKQNSLVCEQISVFEISDEEPFLGFSESSVQKIEHLATVTNKYKDINDCVLTKLNPTNVTPLTQTSLDLITPHSKNANSFVENVSSENMSKNLDTKNKYDVSQSFLDFAERNEENYNTNVKNCNNQYLSEEACSPIPKVDNIEEVLSQNKSSIIENSQILLANSLEEPYNFKENELKLENVVEVSKTRDDKAKHNITDIVEYNEESFINVCSNDKNSNKNEYELKFHEEDTISNFINNETLYVSCNSETFSMNDQDQEHHNDSLFQKPDLSLIDNTSGSDETHKYLYSIEQSFNDDARENETFFERTSLSYADSYQDNVISMLCEVDDTNDNFENTLQENSCISYVTTRKKNDVINDSFILSFEKSFSSPSGSDFDKTVLKNTKYSIDNTKEIQAQVETINSDTNITSDIQSPLQINKNSTSDNPTDLAVSSDLKVELPTKSMPPRPSFRTRKSSILSRKSVNRQSVVENSLRRNRKSKTPIQLNTDKPNKISTLVPAENLLLSNGENISFADKLPTFDVGYSIVLEPGKRWERSLSIYRRITTMNESFDSSILNEEPLNNKGRKYRQSVISTMEMQNSIVSLHNESLKSRKSIFPKPSRSTIKIVRESNASRISLCSTTASETLHGFLTEDCDDTIVGLSKLSIIDSDHEVTVLDKFNDTSNRIITARDYILRRCNQTDVILFDECYPDTVLKNCRKIGEGVYGEVFLWRARDGRARVLKIVPIAGTVKVNGENQKDYHEVISEIVIAMELSALRAPIQEIEKHLDEGKAVETLDLHSVENATDVFNEVLAVRCVYGSYPSRLLDLWELYDECKGSDNDNPAVLPVDQQFMVLELANAGQDLESYQFTNAEQAYALFQQVAYGLAVAEEAFQFEHRDLHWGNVLISPTDQKYATFVLRGRAHRVARRGVAATVIDYSLSRLSLRLAGAESASLYNDLAADDGLFDAVGDYQFEVYRLMREKLGNDWKNFEPYTNILWLHYTVDKMITALRYTRTNTKIHKHYIARLNEIKNRILDYGSAVQYVLIDNEL